MTLTTGGGGRGRGKDGKEKETFACTFPGCGQVCRQDFSGCGKGGH